MPVKFLGKRAIKDAPHSLPISLLQHFLDHVHLPLHFLHLVTQHLLHVLTGAHQYAIADKATDLQPGHLPSSFPKECIQGGCLAR